MRRSRLKRGEPKFGSVAWQNMMAEKVADKVAKGQPLGSFEKTFVEVQLEHRRRRT